MIIADTGFWVAIFDSNDAYHKPALQAVKQLQEPLITTIPVLTEVCYLLQRRRGQHYVLGFLRSHRRQAFRIFTMDEQHIARSEQLMHQYESLPMDFADASLVLLAEHLGHGRIFSTDQRDFCTYRWKNHHPFQNLLALK